MEALAVGNMHATVGSEIGFCNSYKKSKICNVFPVKTRNFCSWQSKKLAIRAVQTHPARPVAGKSKSSNVARLFVGLPLDTVSECGTINHARAIAAGIKALKLLGVEGVELPIWWGVVEKEAMGKYEWASYLALAEMIEKAGLKLHVSLCFHASKQPSGQYYKDCLSLAVDELPVLNGKTAIDIYHEFCNNFKSTFSSFMGSTITGISVGLGPDGELRYPSLRSSARAGEASGAGEFQCYDKNMLNILKQHAEATGNPLWGLGGPHDAPSYDQSPLSNNFFKDHGGSWETSYGDFFLSWYSNQLISHGDRILSAASSTFQDSSVEIYGKLPLMHHWYCTRSHPSELTAGLYNTQTTDGYDAVAEMFAKNSVGMILPGMDLSDEHRSSETLSSPESLLAQIRAACRKHGIKISGQNSSVSGVPGGFQQIKKNVSGENLINLFIYQRMGAHFFSPEHFHSFTNFVRSLSQPEMNLDDLAIEDEGDVESLQGSRMQEAA